MIKIVENPAEFQLRKALRRAKDLNNINSIKDSSPSAQNDAKIRSQSDIELIYQRYLQAFKKGVYNYGSFLESVGK